LAGAPQESVENDEVKFLVFRSELDIRSLEEATFSEVARLLMGEEVLVLELLGDVRQHHFIGGRNVEEVIGHGIVVSDGGEEGRLGSENGVAVVPEMSRECSSNALDRLL